MGKVRILHICDKLGRSGATIHGVSQLFSWWWAGFDRDQFQLKLIVLRGNDKSSQELRKKGVPHVLLNTSKFNFFVCNYVVDFIKKNDIHVVHAHGYGAANIGVYAAHRAGIKAIVHEHFIDANYPFYQKPFDFLIGRNSDRGIAVSQAVKEFMVDQRSMHAEKIDVIYNGVPVETFLAPTRESVIDEKKRLGLPLDATIIATIGRLDEEKGNCYFLKSACEILKKGYDVHFILFGDGSAIDDLRMLCREKGIVEHVLFAGYYRDMAMAYAMTDILVIPSLTEGGPLTMFEAFATGTPVVGTSVGAIREIVKDGENGLIVAVRNEEEITDKVCMLLEDEKMRKSLSIAAKIENEKYNMQVSIAQISRLYSDLYFAKSF